jgi:hypothetical protein
LVSRNDLTYTWYRVAPRHQSDWVPGLSIVLPLSWAAA